MNSVSLSPAVSLKLSVFRRRKQVWLVGSAIRFRCSANALPFLAGISRASAWLLPFVIAAAMHTPSILPRKPPERSAEASDVQDRHQGVDAITSKL